MLATLITGLAIGSIYAVIAVGYNLTWLTSRVINFAYAAFVVTGMFFTVWLYGLGLSFPLILLILVGIGALVALAEYLVAILPLRNRGDHAELVTTVGVTTILQGLIFLTKAPDGQRVPSVLPTGLVELFDGSRMGWAEILVIAVTVVVALGAHLWTTRTRTGLAALAQSEDQDAALVLGVRPQRIAIIMFVVSGSLGFVVAPFIGAMTFAVVALAITLAVKGFVVLALGGIGSQLGALVAGLFLGIVEALVLRFTDAVYQNLVIYLIFIFALLVRPQGLFGAVRAREV